MNWSEWREAAPMLLLEYGINFFSALLILLVGHWLAKRLVAWASRTAQENGLDATLCGFLSKLVYIAVLIMLAIAAISRLGVPTTSFIAMIGAAGLAIGLALQGSLSNFASGVLLVFLKPCQVGDYIESGGFAGTVVRVQLFNTILLTPDRRTVIIPNTKLFNDPMVNYSTSATRRIDLVIAISYDADIEKAKSLLRSAVEAESRVLQEPAVQIGVTALAETSININVRPWVNSADYLSVKYSLNEKIKHALDQAGIEIPLPKMQVQFSGAQIAAAPLEHKT